jgi:hypothetical protein
VHGAAQLILRFPSSQGTEMQSAPPLLLVKLVLPLSIQPLNHVHQLISDCLIPDTIDGAVYNELHRVMKVYEPYRPLTAGAMDGAARRGRLGIMQTLHDRLEGCSSKAFTGAAANGHMEVVWWLNEFYARLSRPAEMVEAAAANGHAQLVKLLLGRLTGEELQPAIRSAASNGQAAVVEALLPRISNTTEAFFAASVNGHQRVLQVLVQRGKI